MTIAESQTINLVDPDREIGLRDNGMLMTPKEYDEHWEWDELYTYELVNGVLVVEPGPSPSESHPNGELGHLLHSYFAQFPDTQDKTLYGVTLHLPNSRRRADRVV